MKEPLGAGVGAFDRIEADLKEIRNLICNIYESPRALTIAATARMLSRSASKIWELIREGDIRTVMIGKARMVPMSEVIRLTTLPEQGATGAPKIGPRYSVRSEVEKARGLRKRRAHGTE